MSDLHIIHTIRAIEDGRLFPLYGDSPQLEMVRSRWLTVLQGQALMRGLDWSKSPVQRKRLSDAVNEGYYAVLRIEPIINTYLSEALNVLGLNDIEVDIEIASGKISFIHNKNGGGIPIGG